MALLHVDLKISSFFILAQVLALALDLNRSVLNELLRCYALILINAKAQIRRVTLTSLLGLSRRELMVSWLIVLNDVLFAVAAGREALHVHALLKAGARLQNKVARLYRNLFHCVGVMVVRSDTSARSLPASDTTLTRVRDRVDRLRGLLN